jgi:CRP-like cAMP-binding protein
MVKTHALRDQPKNRLLARLPQGEYQRLSHHLQAVPLPVKQVIYAARAPIDYAYFPNRGVLSAISVMSDGRAIEVANIGNEGVAGLTAFIGDEISANEVIMQVEGDGLRMKADVLKDEANRKGPLRQLLLLYNSAYQMQVSYSVACNGLHPIQQRCCRWLLMTQDRVGSDVFSITHEFLAIMLGVRRSSVTEVLHPLRERGLIRNGRGTIQVLDRPGLKAATCECYQGIQDEYNRLLG